ncbi:MAG: AAA family ATPase [Candidatus Paceibacterota bacterium]|jgi:ATP-dependent Clp protease ATP-binding subunit ClpC
MDKQEQEKMKDLQVYPLLILEEIFPHALRHKFIGALFASMSFFFLIFFSLSVFNRTIPADQNAYATAFLKISLRVGGVFLLLFSFWLFVFLLESFYRAVYFHNRAYKIKKRSGKDVAGESYEMSSEVASVFYYTQNGDIIKSFFNSILGYEILVRCGLLSNDIQIFLEGRSNVLELTLEDMHDNSISDMEDFAVFLFKNYPDFSDFLFRSGVGEKDFLGAVKWAVKSDEDRRFKERWWSRDNLKKLGSLGRDFSFGNTYMINKYSREITIGGAAPSEKELHWEDEVNQVENTLSKGKESNIMLVGDDGVGVLDIVYEFAYRIDSRGAPPSLLDQRVLLVDSNLLMATAKEKGILEQQLIRLLNEAVKAGNIILAFDHFSSFVLGARSLGVDVIDIMNPYLLSPKIHIIIMSPTEEYHRVLAPNGEIATRFEVIKVKQPENSKVITLLEDGALMLERKYGIFFTYPAIVEILRSAENYITEGVMPDKATDLLMEIPSFANQHGAKLIDKNIVLDYVRFKTKIPVGEIKADEKSKLENLETELHKRIVGQNDAVVAIANTMRRSRAGVRDPKKPIGSFLFLGPTGVGKTETAKALAAIYFENEERMARLDMSEYQGADSLARLIGSFESGKPGNLSMLVKNFPYGVLLLDEFEKTSPDVQNLFLQVLDEGFFSDMGGHRVNVRNIIFIATSNAGSDLMYESITHGESIHALRQVIVDSIIKKGILKPELINRFDGVILFNPLERKDITEVARIMAENLRKRLKEEQSIDLVVNEPLIQALVNEGLDPLFGGRPMSRAVKEKIEKIIAQKIISGEIKTGMTVELTEEELKKTGT